MAANCRSGKVSLYRSVQTIYTKQTHLATITTKPYAHTRTQAQLKCSDQG